MADVGVQYTLTTPALTIVFNNGATDQLYISEIRGLGAPVLRTPTDNVPLGDGAIIHSFWKGARLIGIDGIMLINSTDIMDSIVVIRNNFEDDLADALESILRADGTLSYAPQGQGTRTYTVRYDIGLEFVHTDNYRSDTFSFGLIAGEPDWSGSS